MIKGTNNSNGGQEIELEKLCEGTQGITPKYGACLAEAAVVCLEDRQHSTGVKLIVDGDYECNLRVNWESLPNPEQAERCWGEEQFTTESGAYGIAVLVVTKLTNYEVIQRSKRGTGFDYWLGQKGSTNPLFQGKTRLEVSGIRKGDESSIRQRVKQKIKQTKISDGALPAIITIVEFGTPRSRVMNK